MESVWLEGHDGLKLRADVGGDRAGPAVLLLHGGGQTRFSWQKAAQALIAAGRFVVSLDQRGHGESAWSDDAAYTIGDFAADVRAVVATMPSLPVIIGASLGGLASLVAIGESETPIAKGMVLVDVTPKMNPDGTDRIRGFMTANPEGFATVAEAADAVAAYLPHRAVRSDTRGLSKNLRLGEDGRYRWHWDPAFLDDRGMRADNEARYEAAARKIRVPTLLVRGSLSEVVNEESVRHFLDLIPQAEYTNIEGAAHMIAGDRNDAFNATVLDFLERVSRTSPPAPQEGIEPALLRAGMGCFSTGVTVVTTRGPNNEPAGFTANSFTSVSLDPPLVLFCLNRTSPSVDAVRDRGAFVVNVLHLGQQAISSRFAMKNVDRFEDVKWTWSADGLPVISEAMASFECTIHEIFEGGDHLIFVGRVCRVLFDKGRDPLLFLHGKYNRVHIPTDTTEA